MEFLKNIFESIINFLRTPSRKRDLFTKIVVVSVSVLLIVIMFPETESFQFADIKVGSVVNREIIAPFTFPILKDEAEFEKEKEEARKSVPPVFDRIDEISKKQLDDLKSFWNTVLYIKNNEFGFKMSDSLKVSLRKKYNLNVYDKRWNLIWQNEFTRSNVGGLDSLTKNITQVVQDLLNEGIINKDKSSMESNQIVVRYGPIEEMTESKYYYDMNEARQRISDKFQTKYRGESNEFKVSFEIASVFIVPNVFYNIEETNKRTENSVAQVAPTRGFVYENERIIDSHEIATPEVIRKLRSLAVAKSEKLTSIGGVIIFLPQLGKLFLVTMILFLFFMYLYFSKPELYNDAKRILLLAIIIVMQIGVVSLLLNQFSSPKFLLPFTMASILLTTLFDAETGFVGTLVISFLLGSVHGNEFDIAFITAFTGTVAVVSFRKIRLRRHFIFGGIYIALSYIATILTLGFLQYSPFIEIGKNILYATLNSLVSSVLAFGLIAIFEWFFDITTDITLLEYADLNNPVLKKLSLEAPGTFHHSILVGNLAEAAAEVIGANSLLARVGSYYHDIGKMEKPEYFVENQMGAENKHEKLSPSMSSLILASHVKTGVEIAEQYKLPKVLRNFIREHHGTSVMNYFYHKALEISEQNEVKDIDYRYPGPEPSSKETAIVMLADSVEAGTRSLQNPTVNRIRGLVESIVETKSNEGQLANCELTLKDLRKITEAFIPVLMAIFHVRVEYPQQEERIRKKLEEQKIIELGS